MRWLRRRSSGAAALDDLDRSFARLLADDRAPRSAAVRVGIEHEYRVIGDAGPVDFRELIGAVDLGVAHLDPRDAFGHRLISGTWLTCDEAEAEVAMPPVPLSSGFGRTLAAAAAGARADLARLLPGGLRIEGYSTHVNVSAPDGPRPAAALLFARTFAPALMLLMDRRTSPGLLVRSRPGRMELGGEFIAGGPLVSAALLAAGGALACLRRVAGRRDAARIPPMLAVEVSREWRRYGWYVDRRAFGVDLYESGRTSVLPLAAGGVTTAQAQLAAAWDAARAALPPGLDRSDLERVSSVVRGDLPLPLESEPAAQADDAPDSVRPVGWPYASAVEPRSRKRFDLGAVLSSWELTVFVLADRSRERRAFACVPDAFLGRFLRLLDRGALDDLLVGYLGTRSHGRTLDDRSQALRPGLWDALGSRRSLLRPEVRPQGTRA